jgi:hypothetical protein
MLRIKGLGSFGGLGAAPSSGYCWINGNWQWTTADQCPKPLVPGGPPMERAGFCWIRQNPAEPFPGTWQRIQAGQTACANPGPPSMPTAPAGWCQNMATGTWEWVLQDQCAQPVLQDSGKTRAEIAAMLLKFRETARIRRTSIVRALVATGQLQPCETVMGARAGVYCKDELGPRENLRLLDPIGVILECGVPFTPDELKAGYLERDFTPNAEQRFWLDMIIYAASQRSLVAGQLSMPSTELYVRPIWQQIAHPTGDLQKMINKVDWSVSETISRFRIKGSDWDPRDGEPVFTTHLPGFSLNPIAPSDAELNGKGGLRAYYGRGGFLLDRQISNGRLAAATSGVSWNTGYCACGNGTPMATFDRATGEGFGWESYITIGEPTYRLRIRPKDAPMWSEAASWAANKMKDLMGFMCSNKDMIQQLNTGVVGKELCHDVNGKPCEKAGPGCYCTQPTGGQSAALAVANAGLSVWCAAPWMPKQETPFTPPPPPAIEAKSPPWWLVGLGGAAIGAIAAALAPKR